MGVILDSSVLIGAERGRLDLEKVLRKLDPSTPVAIASITASELLHGVERADTAERKARRGKFVEGILKELPVFGFQLGEARIHARLWAFLHGKGQMIGAHDLIIAAACLNSDFALATLNRDEFERVPELKLVDL